MKQGAKVLFKQCVDQLISIYDTPEAQTLVYWLFEDFLNLRQSTILAEMEIEIPDSKRKELDEIIDRLQRHEPIQHILGHAFFFGRKFKVTPDVLIPRQETEELVDEIIKCVQNQSLRILDIGTGSGIIPITLKLDLPGCKTRGWDISPSALDVARKNAIGLGADVQFECRDIFGVEVVDKWDLIVSNPPYVLESEKKDMSSNVLNYDPENALFVPDDDPLKFYRAITSFAQNHLENHGFLFFEVNSRFGKEIGQLMTNAGFHDVRIIKDLNEKDRIVTGQLL